MSKKTITLADAGAQTEARAIAQVFDDLPTYSGYCEWPAVANARDEALRIHATALAAKDAELAAANDAWRAMKDRAHAAETQLAEAWKALEEIGNGCDGRIDKDALPCRIARRVREGGTNG